jgi:hypothetical protein
LAGQLLPNLFEEKQENGGCQWDSDISLQIQKHLDILVYTLSLVLWGSRFKLEPKTDFSKLFLAFHNIFGSTVVYYLATCHSSFLTLSSKVILRFSGILV